MVPKPAFTLKAASCIPQPLYRLRELALNIRWAWHEDTANLFRRLDPELWSQTRHNPIALLGLVDQEGLDRAARDTAFMEDYAAVCDDFDAYLGREDTWYRMAHEPRLTAYFSAEFGVTECLPIYSGGLGVLAGDHLKSASDLGVPVVGVGLLYRQGYFTQVVNAAGQQREAYTAIRRSELPLTLERDDSGAPIIVTINLDGREVSARIWRIQVGRVALYLLDTNYSGNKRAEDRDLTDYLYGGGNELRVRQEILLGIGGYRALNLLGLNPQVYHVNEGHSAFLTLEHTRHLMQRTGLSFDEARIAASASVVFTTHTPVPAGHDRFSPDLMERYMVRYAERELGLTPKAFLALGRENPDDDHEAFGMTKLAMRMSASTNGVARLHGKVSRQMWQPLWPGLPAAEVPIGHVTNGIHLPTWVSSDLQRLFVEYLGDRWADCIDNPDAWSQTENIPDEAIWNAHVACRAKLVDYAKRSLRAQMIRNGASDSKADLARKVLDRRAFTIGFARRFATYKRATLLLRDPVRLEKLLSDSLRPVQIIFAGKAHPKDLPGKALIQTIAELSQSEAFRKHVVFLEDYDMAIGRYLTQGVDLWLNTPRRPREASGTSGMKAAANGVLNLSVLDGWWDEGYESDLGWAIGNGEVLGDEQAQDDLEADLLYDALENRIVRLFYDPLGDGLPTRWIKKMKRSIAMLSPRFNSDRMVKQYVTSIYAPASARSTQLLAHSSERACRLAAWESRVRAAWDGLRVEVAPPQNADRFKVGDTLHIQAQVRLGNLSPEDVVVQLYSGRVGEEGAIVEPRLQAMHAVEHDGEGMWTYRTEYVQARWNGPAGFTVRVLPSHADLANPFAPGLIKWAEPAGT